MKVRYSHWIPRWRKKLAMTLYPYLLFPKSREETAMRTILHETVHFRQIKRIGFIKWYSSYLWHFVKGFFQGKSRKELYRSNPYEKEAFEQEDQIVLTEEEKKALGLD